VLIDQQGLGEISNYRRSLDLETGVATTTFDSKGVTYTREVFASYPAQVVVVRLTASRPVDMAFSVSMKSAHDGAVFAGNSKSISMKGRVADSAIQYEARLVMSTDGMLTDPARGQISVEHANHSTVILSGATNFKNFRDVSADPVKRNDQYLSNLPDYKDLKTAHIADHQRLFGRVKLDLGGSDASAKPTDERIRAFAKGSDPQLVALLFQFGRYLMIAASRPGGQPATLQGLWNSSNTPAWDSKYTVNINTEMNYWPVSDTNLAECELPLFDALKEVAQSGAVTAKEMYGARGWVARDGSDQCFESWDLGDGRRLAFDASLGALSVQWGSSIPERDRLPVDAWGCFVLRGCDGDGSEVGEVDYRA
jgi:alpha-L-fucosidase 2